MPDSLESIGVNIPSLIAYLINFTALMGVLYVIAYRPFLRLLKERQDRVQAGIARAQEAETALARVEEDSAKIIEEAKQKARLFLDEATRQAEAELAQVQARAREEADEYIHATRQQLEEEKRRVYQEFQVECAELVALAAEKILGTALDLRTHREVIHLAIEEVSRAGRQTKAPLGAPFARVKSAVPLTQQELAELSNFVSTWLQRPTPLFSSVEPRLLGGFILSAGDTVIDASVSNRLEQFRHGLERGFSLGEAKTMQ
jgi:F-type H+-transporting ATPase subunit b